MSETGRTGSFWLCPQCGKHVPSRSATCRCGSERSAASNSILEVRLRDATSAEAEHEVSPVAWSRVAWMVAGMLAFAAATYISADAWLYQAGRNDALTQHLKRRREAAASHAPAAALVPAPAPVIAPPPPARRASVPPPDSSRAPATRVAFGVTVEDTALGGVLITYVHRGGPGEVAGLRVGDRIEGIDGQPIAGARSFSAVLDQLMPGRTVPVDVSRDGRRLSLSFALRDAAEVFRAACDAGDAQGCASIGQRLRTGDTVAPDPGQAREALRKACDAQVLSACINLGNMYRTGQGGPVDGPEAVRLFQRACDAEIPTGCFNLGVVYLKGEGVPQDPNLSRRYFEMACEMGDDQACRQAEHAAKH